MVRRPSPLEAGGAVLEPILDQLNQNLREEVQESEFLNSSPGDSDA